MEQVAKHLVLKYPSFGDVRRQERGWEMWFFHTPFAPAATGFLEERLKSQRKKINKKTPTKNLQVVLFNENSLSWNSDDDDEPEPDERKFEYMRQNKGVEVINIMKNTVFQRRTLIRRHTSQPGTLDISALPKLCEILRPLFDTDNMIVQDFNIRHPTLSLIMYDRWPKVAKLLLEYAEKSGINYGKKLGISKNRYDFTNDDTYLVAYSLLPFILPSTGRRLKCDSQDGHDSDDEEAEGPPPPKRSRGKRQSKGKASDLDTLQSLIIFKPKLTHVAKVIKENTTMSPFILALGSPSNLEFVSFFVIFQKIAIPCGEKFLKAFDTCFKLFTVLYVPLPLKSLDLWMFIVHGVGGKPCLRDELPPVVQSLIGQIMPRV
ncbi:uncharacterized protein LOC118437743 [Folsomia candida]|nr:uncharacterized protein LOC118437743 [Folsomia candida]